MEGDRSQISKLLHPGLLTISELTEILQSYCITTDPSLSKDELVDIFKRVAMPLPQRTYGNSWRERLLDKKRFKRRITIEPECSEPKSRRLSSNPILSESKAPANRLKPPPSLSDKTKDMAASEKKIIRLAGDDKKPGDKVAADGLPPVNGKHKRIRIDFSDSSEKSTPIPRVVSSKKIH